MFAVVFNHHLRDGHILMTLITFQDGVAVMRDGKVGTGLECCCGGCAPCPDMESLCISITLTDHNGNVFTADQGDMFWFNGTGTVYLDGFAYAVGISCTVANGSGGISVFGGWASLIPGCDCTSASGSESIPCAAAAGWHVGEVTFDLFFDDVGIPCAGGCPATVGTVTVTISDPPC